MSTGALLVPALALNMHFEKTVFFTHAQIYAPLWLHSSAVRGFVLCIDCIASSTLEMIQSKYNIHRVRAGKPAHKAALARTSLLQMSHDKSVFAFSCPRQAGRSSASKYPRTKHFRAGPPPPPPE